jgi:hypothetical protein
MRRNANQQLQIAGRATSARDLAVAADCARRTIFDPGGDRYREPLKPLDEP